MRPTIERIARALWEADGQPMKAQDTKPAISPPEPESNWERYIPWACSVLQAIREPSEEMVEKAYQDDAFNAGDPFEVWQVMVDAALNEGIWDR